MKRKVIIYVLLTSLFYLIMVSSYAQPGGPGKDPEAPQGEMCAGGINTITSNISGTSYQWQVNTGNGFVNITNNSNYSGTNAKTLILSNIPSLWYGYQFRNVVDGNNSQTYPLTFVNNWTGSKSTAWENPGNWSCGTVPDINSDVYIFSGSVTLSSDASCRSLRLNPGAALTVSAGFILRVTK